MKVTAEHLDTPSKSDTFTQLPTRSSSSSIEHDGRIHAATHTDQKDRIVLLIAFMPKKFLNPRQKYQDIPPAAKNFDRHLFPEAGTAVTEAVGRRSRISRACIPGEALYRQEEAVRLYFFTLSDKTFFFGQKTGIIMSCSSYLVPICTLAACGCTSQYIEIGNNWISTNERVVMIDTCSVDISSIRIDSVQTSGDNAVYAGCRESPYWGRTDISSYLTFKATEDYEDSSTPEYEERIIFDSLTLYMVPDSTFCGDTLLPMTYQVYRLSETVEPDDDNVLYSHHEFSFNPDPVAEKTFYQHPFRGRAVEIRLSDELGEEMLEKIVDGDEEMTDDDSFREYFNGLLLKSAGAPGSISGFKGQDTLCMMKLYYRTQDYGEEISSTLTGNMSFMSGMGGIFIKIGFPYLNNLRSIWDHCRAASGRSGLDWALSTGMSFPLRNSTAFYWSLRFKRNSYTYPTRNTVTENMLTLTLGVSFGETWFVRRKFE